MKKSEIGKTSSEKGMGNKDTDLKYVLQLLQKRAGADFSHYKMSTINRRIQRRMAEHKLKDLKQYATLLKNKRNELDHLYADLLINVTSFFRDPQLFAYLKKTLLPRLLKSKEKGELLRIWVPGCATGEEAYSIAMLLYELQEENKGDKVPFQIFATDLSERAIGKARIGEYTEQEVSQVSRKRLKDFFNLSKGKYRVNQKLRDVCVFSVHNLLSDPAFSRMDLISCCNLLIYLDSFAQKKVISSFHFGLYEGGWLLLGKSETTGSAPLLFTPGHKKLKIYIKKTSDKGRGVKLPSEAFPKSPTLVKRTALPSLNKQVAPEQVSWTTAVDNLLLSSYVPASAVINHKLEVLHFRGDTTPFFKLAGKATFHILKIVRPEFVLELRNAISTAIKSKSIVHRANLESPHDAGTKAYSLEVAPLNISGEEPLLLVTFRENPVVEIIPANFKSVKAYDRARDRKIKNLEEKLLLARSQMRQMGSEQEQVIEELQSANEEIVSSNEELRTVNEELETSKEEIEATNEELISSNKELQKRNEEVEALNNYSSSILATIPDPMLILDRKMNIKSANEQFLKTFGLNEGEVTGVSVFKLNKTSWDIPELKTLLQQITGNKTAFKKKQIKHTFGSLGEKVLIFSAKLVSQENNKRERLTLLIIEDITEEVRREEELRVREKEILATQIESQAKIDAHHRSLLFLESVFMNAPFPILVLRGPELRYDLVNQHAKILVGNREVVGRTVREVFPEVERQGIPQTLDNVYRTGVPFIGKETYVEYNRYGDGIIHPAYLNLVYQPLIDLDGKTIDGVLIVAMEVTDQVLARKKVEESEAQFVALADNIQNLAWMADPSGWIYWYNKRWYDYTGTRPKEMEGWGWKSVHDPEYLPGVLEKWNKSIETGSLFEMTFPIKGADGVFRQFLTRVYPIKDDEGKVIRWIGTNTDVHEQKSFSDELEKAVQERTMDLMEANLSLQKANEQLNSFNYISSHDLQEPLRKIRTFAKLIERDNLSDTTKDYLFRMGETVNRMQQLLDDLLAYSRTRTTEKAFELADLDLLVEYVKKDLEEIITEKKAVIETVNLGKANVIPFQFKQLIQNLVGNSLKFSKSDITPHVRIESKTVSSDQVPDLGLSAKTQYHHLSIRDNGIGFDPEYSNKIFEIFQRLHDREEYPGTGIGLAIVKRIVENHNGFICAVGQPEKGATFDIYIPQISRPSTDSNTSATGSFTFNQKIV